MFKPHLEILSHDEEMSTIFARGVSGSITLDIIPDAVAYLKSHPSFERMYLQDFTNVEFIVSQGSTIENAIQSWETARDLKRGTYVPKSSAIIMPEQSSSEAQLIL